MILKKNVDPANVGYNSVSLDDTLFINECILFLLALGSLEIEQDEFAWPIRNN